MDVSDLGRESRGCICRVVTLPEHNPRPRTAKGKARHADRSESDRARAEKAWLTGRCYSIPTKGRAYRRRTKM
jgi:hypothetical protein